MNKFILGLFILSMSLNVVYFVSLHLIIKKNEVIDRGLMEFHDKQMEEFGKIEAKWIDCENAVTNVLEINEALVMLREKNDEFWRRWHNGTFKIPKLIDSARERRR